MERRSNQRRSRSLIPNSPTTTSSCVSTVGPMIAQRPPAAARDLRDGSAAARSLAGLARLPRPNDPRGARPGFAKLCLQRAIFARLSWNQARDFESLLGGRCLGGELEGFARRPSDPETFPCSFGPIDGRRVAEPVPTRSRHGDVPRKCKTVIHDRD